MVDYWYLQQVCCLFYEIMFVSLWIHFLVSRCACSWHCPRLNSLLGISYRELNLDLDRKVRRPYLPSILMFMFMIWQSAYHFMMTILRIHDILPSRSWYPMHYQHYPSWYLITFSSQSFIPSCARVAILYPTQHLLTTNRLLCGC